MPRSLECTIIQEILRFSLKGSKYGILRVVRWGGGGEPRLEIAVFDEDKEGENKMLYCKKGIYWEDWQMILENEEKITAAFEENM